MFEQSKYGHFLVLSTSALYLGVQHRSPMYFHLCKPLFNPLHTSEGQFDQGGHPNILNRKWQGFKTDTLIQHYTNWFEWARWNITSHKPIEYLNYYCQNPNNVTEETEPRTVCQTSSLQTEERPPVWTHVPTCAPTGHHVTPSVTGKERLQIIIYFWSQYWVCSLFLFAYYFA